jgi:two-component system response regulator NreC
VSKLRILIADDHGLVRRGAREVLNSQDGWTVVGEATNGRQAIQRAEELKPDVAVVDIGMPDIDGIETTRQIRTAVPEVKVLVLTMHESGHMVRRALDAGASGYLLKSDLTRRLPEAVKAIAEGKRFLTPKVSEIVLEGFLKTKDQVQDEERAGARTTPREIEIIRFLAEGKANKEIAELLGIAVRTVETHRSKIMSKLDIHSVAGLVHYALRHEITSVKNAR